MISTTGIRGDGMNSFALLALSIAVLTALAGCPSEDDGKCEDVSDCLAGELCVDSRCTRPSFGSRCNDDRECGEGVMCEGGRCATPCDEGGACPEGEVCSARAGAWRASCIRACDELGQCPDPEDVCAQVPGGERGCIRKGQVLSACVGTSDLVWCEAVPVDFVCGSESFIDACWDYESEDGVNFCPGISRIVVCSWDQLSCRCPEGTLPVDCWNREPCSPNCFSNFGQYWGCQSITELDPQASCDTTLTRIRGTCHCRDGFQVNYDGCGEGPSSCEQICSAHR